MSDLGEIIAIGGGGLGRNPNQPIIEKYIVDQSLAEKPNIFFPKIKNSRKKRQNY